jgi:hypothetical protein
MIDMSDVPLRVLQRWVNLAPKEHNVIAQGTALGLNNHNISSPNGAGYCPRYCFYYALSGLNCDKSVNPGRCPGLLYEPLSGQR